MVLCRESPASNILQNEVLSLVRFLLRNLSEIRQSGILARTQLGKEKMHSKRTGRIWPNCECSCLLVTPHEHPLS